MSNKVDLVVIGSGPGGYPAALQAAKLGKKVVIIEKRALGGTCLNRGCIPTKTLLHAAESIEELKKMETIGITAHYKAFDMSQLIDRKNQVVESLKTGIESSLKKHKIEVVDGVGKIISKHCVEVKTIEATYTIEANYILIATGSIAAIPPIEGIDLDGVMTSDELLDLKSLPQHLLIIGGGVIGVEFASIYHALGCEVTIIEMADYLISNLDKELSRSLQMIVKKKGINIFTTSKVSKITKDEVLSCHFEANGKLLQQSADMILVATGRKPYIEGLYTDDMHFELNHNTLLVNKNFQSNYQNIYAIGDVIGGMQLAHLATAQGINAVNHMFKKQATMNVSYVPSCIYTNPEIASIGLTIDEAKKENINAKAYKYTMSANGKSFLTMQERGFIKIVVDVDTRKLIGAQMMCARATDMISELSQGIVNGLTVEEMLSVIHPHPTFSEGIYEVLSLAAETK